MVKFKSKIRNIPDFPEKGIVFRDISPLLADGELFAEAVKKIGDSYINKEIDKVVGIDARGFILAAAVAHYLKKGMVMVRKKGKLPFQTESEEYNLEYGKAALEIQKDAIMPGEKILLVDDVLATGGTMLAAARLVEKLKGRVVGSAFLISLDYLSGKEKLKNYYPFSLVVYQ